MLFKNDVFKLNGVRYRLLDIDARPLVTSAWVIDIDDSLAMPTCLLLSDIAELDLEPAEEGSIGDNALKHVKKCEFAWARLSPLLESAGSRLFHPELRSFEIQLHASKLGCSKVTLYKYLRRYWQRGQTKFALLPDYKKCGKPIIKQSAGAIAAKRGRPRADGQKSFQMAEIDAAQMRSFIERVYIKDQRITMSATYAKLLLENYRYEDGNRNLHLMPIGQRPSFRQFRSYLKANFNQEVILRGRKGNSDYEQNHRKVLGTVQQDCLGVGHYYEIDATIVDIFVVSSEDRRKIVGKPTLYLIIDRQSRLILGFYLGLEHASWAGALQAILSISEDKAKLCKYYEVGYNPEDWPAHQVFPQEFLADRGEMLSQSSGQIADGLALTVTNLPAKRPEWKPLVECRFRLLQDSVRPIAKAYDPPENAKKRQGKNYAKDACHTVRELGAIFLNAIISHNRREILDYPLSNKELRDNVKPCPIELWNYGVVTRSGVLSRYQEQQVRYALLPKAEGVVTENGIEINGCYYTCPVAIERKWFEAARNKRFKVKVSYDKRLVDFTYVHYTVSGKEVIDVATLTPRSEQFKGHSVGEVEYYMSLRRKTRANSVEQRLTLDVNLLDINKQTVAKSVAALKAAGPVISRQSRRKDTKEERMNERAKERQERAGNSVFESTNVQSNVVSLQGNKVTPTQHLSPIQVRLAAAREKMKKVSE